MKKEYYTPSTEQTIIDIKEEFRKNWGDLIVEENEITWFVSYNSAIYILENILNCTDHNLTPEHFIVNKDNYIYWQGMKNVVSSIIKAAEKINALYEIEPNIKFSHVSLDEQGIIFYFNEDPVWLVKDNMMFLFSSSLCDRKIGEKGELFACNLDHITSIIMSAKEPKKNNVKKISKKTYVMLDQRTKYYKIGCSTEPFYREKTLQSDNPEVDLLFFCDTLIERELHEKYSHCRIRGEWFDLSNDEIIEIYDRFSKEKGFVKKTDTLNQ